MAKLIEASRLVNLVFVSDSNPYGHNMKLSRFNSFNSKKPSALLLLRLHSPTTPCSAATPPQPGDLDLVLDSATDRSRDRRRAVRLAWEKLVRWSKFWRSKAKTDVLERTNKVLFVFFLLIFPFLLGFSSPKLPLFQLRWTQGV